MAELGFRAKLTLEATVSPSEDATKVAGALRNITGGFGEAGTGVASAELTTEDTRALSHIRGQLRDRRIRSAARRKLLLNTTGRTTSMMLNRQAAAAGVIALCGSPDESPLGPIYATLESERVAELIDWLTAYAEG